MSWLFKARDEYFAVRDELIEAEGVVTDDLAERWEAALATREDQIDWLAKQARVADIEIGILQDEKRRLDRRLKAAKARKQWARVAICERMQDRRDDGATKPYRSALFTVSLKATRKTLTIDDDADLPPTLYLPAKPNRSAVEAAVKTGQTFDGVHYEAGETVSIR